MTQEKLYIWGERIPGNHAGSKTDVMDIHDEYTPQDLFEKYPGIWDKTTDIIGDMSGNATLVYRQEIEHGPAGMTYEDKPFLIPYLVEGADSAVIICPGGAYLTKSMTNEGEHIAQRLNQAGISAFVLWYRTYPYQAPVPFWDAQRAIRYVRYHANDWKLNPQKISMIGFSAGGNLAGVTGLVMRNQEISADSYQADAIDHVSAELSALALIYPAIALEDDKILVVLAGEETYNDKEKGRAFASSYDMRTHVREGDSPLFLCAALDDEVVPARHLFDLAKIAEAKGIPTEVHVFAEGGHGFGGCQDEQMPQFYHDRTLVEQWLDLYVAWLSKLTSSAHTSTK
ncbi:alpha/beta hydrolase [Streptococcus ovuberis]|uniref:Alpha/beta hydrolase n=1 Tax=Streptococcus ovuberis TaxID=1936207 RepID=A0A7X6MWY6_9STRE|nr:alpha/beta hydrolase [Streptococcus ovuberis]NKZ19905.1 alpha/beta hydrolase [Streptococcus ovuberis]